MSVDHAIVQRWGSPYSPSWEEALGGDAASDVCAELSGLWADATRSVVARRRACRRVAGGLERFLEHINQYKDAVWIARRDDIARHWRRRMGLPPLAE